MRAIFERQYKEAAAEGAIVELRMRMLANKIPELRPFAHQQNLGDVETPIIEHFANALTEEEKSTLTRCRQLRNKILHCDFRAARQKLGELGITTPGGNARVIDVRGLRGAPLRKKVMQGFAGVEGSYERVTDARAGADDIYGWLIEMGGGGDFLEAARAFSGAVAIVDRLALI